MARLRLAALGVAGAALLSGCGLGTAGGFIPTGDLAGEVAGVDLSGSEVAVGSKNFNESVLLGKMTVLLAQAAGADVQDLTNMPGSASARQAQVEGLVDVEWEYTGTAWLTYLGHEDPIPDPQAQWEAVRDEDAQIGLTWLPPAELDNTYAFTVRQDTAERLGVRSLADIKDLPEQEQTFCVDAEFASRNDGFRPLLAAYGLGDLPDSRVRIMDIGAVYQAVANGECTFGEAYATDGRIAALDLAVLEDPLPFFPSYNVAPVVREEALAEDPELAVLLEAMRVRLDNETAAELNARIDVYGEEPVDVAWDWLVAEGLLTERQD
ncbi:glycine betaine ABC transporter substrate-binding protein [Micrococcus sp.]|uniref:glycine betaine ABC transporter substrate-binding protein n=1 Tax=Micrococcus sp. TaxID=1271 RepID=UPI0039C74A7D